MWTLYIVQLTNIKLPSSWVGASERSCLALTPEDEPTGEPGANLGSLEATLRCGLNELEDAINVLSERRSSPWSKTYMKKKSA